MDFKIYRLRDDTMSKIIWKKIDKNTWENQEKNRKYDFVITKLGKNNYSLVIFNANIIDNNIAFIDSIGFDKLTDAKKEASLWI